MAFTRRLFYNKKESTPEQMVEENDMATTAPNDVVDAMDEPTAMGKSLLRRSYFGRSLSVSHKRRSSTAHAPSPIAATFTFTPGRCETCRSLDPWTATERLPGYTLSALVDGVFLAWLGPSFSGESRECDLCGLLARLHVDCGGSDADVRPVQLRAFPLVPHLALRSHRRGFWSGDKNYVFELEDLTDFFLAVVPADFSHAGGRDGGALERFVEGTGFVMWHREMQKDTRLFTPRVVGPRFEPRVVGGWLDCCGTHHGECWRGRGADAPGVAQLVDCETRKVISVESLREARAVPDYVALSYVWGSKNGGSGVPDPPSETLPRRLPQVVEDAVAVTLALGFRFLWVDKYCVSQHDGAKRYEQMMRMDSVYREAALTIIAAAGEDENCGLPGVSSERRPRQQQTAFEHERFSLSSTLPSPRGSILDSRWATRGWTYQEAVLSSRRLVFTRDQLYFECASMNCYESLGISFEDLYRKRRPHLEDYVGRSLFGAEVVGSARTGRVERFLGYMHCAEEYSRRELGFDDDGLNAFGGIVKRFESVPTFPVRQVWGVPFSHPADGGMSSEGEVDYLGFFLAALSWRHELDKPVRRRKQFPSWSWAGWEGEVVWPKPVDRRSFASPEGATGGLGSVRVCLDDGTTVSLSETDPRGGRRVSQPKALLVQTSAVPRTAFVSDAGGCSMRLASGGAVRLYPSKEGLDAAKAFKRIQSGRYEVLRMGVVGDEAYLMLVKWYRNSAYRVGMMVVNRFWLTCYTPVARTFKIK